MPITVGNTVTSASLTVATANPYTLALTNNKNTVIVAVAIRDTRTAAVVSTASYGGVTMTQEITRLRTDGDTTEDLRVYIFRLSNAPTGANNISITLDSTAEYWAVFGIACDRITNIGQPNISGGADADSTAGTDPSVVIVTTSKDAILIDCVYNKSGTSMTAGTSQIIVYQVLVNGGTDRALMGYKIVSTVGSQTSTYTETADDDWCMVSAAEKSNLSQEFFQMFY